VRAEISYDLVMEEEMAFAEGAFRLPGGEWQVFVFHRHKHPQWIWQPHRWKSGVGGVIVVYPSERVLNRAAVEGILSNLLDVSEWVEVRGPDSMQLR
jgi:hypothetical protein